MKATGKWPSLALKSGCKSAGSASQFADRGNLGHVVRWLAHPDREHASVAPAAGGREPFGDDSHVADRVWSEHRIEMGERAPPVEDLENQGECPSGGYVGHRIEWQVVRDRDRWWERWPGKESVHR